MESDIVDDDSQVTGLTRDSVNGGYLIDVTNNDGSPGVKTENGSRDPEDPAIFIPDGKILDTVNTAWGLNRYGLPERDRRLCYGRD